LTYYIFI